MTISPATTPAAASPLPVTGTAALSKGGENLLPAFAEALLSLGFGDTGSTRKSKADVKLPIKDERRSPVSFPIPVPVASISDLRSYSLQPPATLKPAITQAMSTAPQLTESAPEATQKVAQPQAPQPAPRKVDAPPPPSADPPAELTFAARVQPTDLQQKASSGAATGIIPVTPKKGIESDAQDPSTGGDANAAAAKIIVAFEPSGRPNPPVSDPPSASSKPVEVATPASPVPPKPPAQPLKDLSLEMSQPGNEKVQVRLVQQSGELHVAVRTGDSELAHGLRQNLPELVGHLEENGFHAEAWRPSVSAASGPGHVLETRSAASGNSQSGDDPQSHSGAQQQDGRRSRQPSNRPAWVEELESSTGESYGIGN